MHDGNEPNDNAGRQMLLDAYAVATGRSASADVACPTWCDVDHPSEHVRDGNYHHDGPAVSMPLCRHSVTAIDGTAEQVFVKPALFVSADDRRRYEPQVEIQTDRETVLELSVPDARELASALQHVADMIEADRAAGRSS